MDRKEILQLLKEGLISTKEARELLNPLKDEVEEDLETEILKEIEEEVEPKVDSSEVLSSLKKSFESVSAEKKDQKYLDAIIGLAPFASAKALNKLLRKELSKEDNVINWDQVISLAPFIDGEALSEIAQMALAREIPNIDFIVTLAPFIDGSDLEKLVKHSKGKLTLELLTQLAPFLGEEIIDNLIEELAD